MEKVRPGQQVTHKEFIHQGCLCDSIPFNRLLTCGQQPAIIKSFAGLPPAILQNSKIGCMRSSATHAFVSYIGGKYFSNHSLLSLMASRPEDSIPYQPLNPLSCAILIILAVSSSVGWFLKDIPPEYGRVFSR